MIGLRHAGAIVVVIVLLAAGACSANDPALPLVDDSAGVSTLSTPAPATPGSATSEPTSTAGPTFEPAIDPAIAPDRALHSFDGAPRPVGAVAGVGGPSAAYASTEIVVFGDRTSAAEIAIRYGGTILRSTDPSQSGVDAPAFHLVRVDPALADLDALVEDLPALGGDVGGLRFSSGDAAGVAAIAAAEAARGVRIALNWVGTPTEIPYSTEELSLGPSGFSTDAYQQDYYRTDTVAGFGVAEAWTSMWHAGALANRVPLAIVDAEFDHDPELAPYVAVSTVPGVDAIGPGLLDGFPHGSIAASIAMAIPDNAQGVAGVAGVVADPILVVADSDIESGMVGLLEAVGLGARIVSMSFIAPVLDENLPFSLEFGEVSRAVRDSGVLMFSSSGNGGGNVDEIVPETPGLHGTVPCQSPGVICVGGLEGADSEERHEDSTHGNVGGSVDIYAPYCVFVGPSGSTRSVARRCGTSLSAPFAAGVAALVWASDPGLTADEVWHLMETTAAGDRWPRVQALDAVRRALSGPLQIEIIEPTTREQDLGRSVGLAATVTVFEEGSGSRDVALTWRSSRDGLITSDSILVSLSGPGDEHQQRASTVATRLSEGTHTITVTATLAGVERTDTITLDVINSPPEPRISQPNDGREVCSGESITFRGQAFDINEQLGLPDSAFRWRSDVDGLIGTGPVVSTSTLSVGSHRIRLLVADSHGLEAGVDMSVMILGPGSPGCENLAPSAKILEPEHLTGFLVEPGDVDSDGPYADVTLRGAATDPEGLPLTIEWFSSAEDPRLLGTGPEITVRLHMFGAACESQLHEIEMRVSDGINTVSDDIRVFVNQFC